MGKLAVMEKRGESMLTYINGKSRERERKKETEHVTEYIIISLMRFGYD